jgi:hypothetical protein
MCKQKKSDGASLQDEMACPDCPRTKKPAQRGRTEATRIIHHLPWQHLPPAEWVTKRTAMLV